MNPGVNAVSHASAPHRIHRPQIVRDLDRLRRRIVRIRGMVESEEEYLDIVRETYRVQASLEQLGLLLLSGHLESCLSSLSLAKQERDELLEGIIDALSAPHQTMFDSGDQI